MKLFFTILNFFFLLNVLGQEKTNFELTKDSDTIFWYSHHLKDIERLNLINPKSNEDFLRISSAKYFLELSDNSNKICFYVNEIWEEYQTGEFFKKCYKLDKKQVDEIKALYEDLKIKEIPSDKKIEKWKSGFDGITYIFETKNNSKYSFKTYWTPTIQDDFDESRRIIEFKNKLDTIVDYTSKIKKFERKIPFYGWSYNNSMIVVKITSNSKEYRKYKRAKKKQQKQK